LSRKVQRKDTTASFLSTSFFLSLSFYFYFWRPSSFSFSLSFSFFLLCCFFFLLLLNFEFLDQASKSNKKTEINLSFPFFPSPLL